jgi:alcohol dehydrogenase class IV
MEIIRILGVIEASDLNDAIFKINSLLNNIGIKLKLSDLRIPFEGIQRLKNCNLERLKNNPAPLQAKDIEQILQTIY